MVGLPQQILRHFEGVDDYAIRVHVGKRTRNALQLRAIA
jgi:hypothetical protein